MKGVTVGQPGEVLWLDYDEPTLFSGDVLLASLACGICATGVKMVKQGSNEKNRYTLGRELAGRSVADDLAARWSVGQPVVAAPRVPRGACYHCLHHQPTLCTRLVENSLARSGLAQQARLPRRLAAAAARFAQATIDVGAADLREAVLH
ncbi:MAG: alcohol dehydrogenase catalytic domain-containing protein [Anaerolineales bacterium]|nr:alcohol dehydrogenase catalytic domain-containing protein [Anaerolineales bacterium]